MLPTCFWFDRWKPLCYFVRTSESAINREAKSFWKSKFRGITSAIEEEIEPVDPFKDLDWCK